MANIKASYVQKEQSLKKMYDKVKEDLQKQLNIIFNEIENDKKKLKVISD